MLRSYYLIIFCITAYVYASPLPPFGYVDRIPAWPVFPADCTLSKDTIYRGDGRRSSCR